MGRLHKKNSLESCNLNWYSSFPLLMIHQDHSLSTNTQQHRKMYKSSRKARLLLIYGEISNELQVTGTCKCLSSEQGAESASQHLSMILLNELFD